MGSCYESERLLKKMKNRIGIEHLSVEDRELLIGDFYEEFFGGEFEQVYTEGLAFFFPQVSPKSIAAIEVEVISSELNKVRLKKLLEGLGLPSLESFYSKEKIETSGMEISNMTNQFCVFEAAGLFIRVLFESRGTVVNFDIIDLDLVVKNSREFTRDEIVRALSNGAGTHQGDV